MNLGGVIERFAGHLATALSLPATAVGSAVPTQTTELPAVALSLSAVTEHRAGVGNIPKPTQKKALQIAIEIDLASPRLVVEGETIELVSSGGHVLQLPVGPLVRADGAGPPLTEDDIAITIDGADIDFAPDGTPGPNQFAVDPAAATTLGYGDPDTSGVFRFGDQLTSGILRATYYLGQWDLTASRFRGDLRIDVFASTSSAVDTLTRAIGDALLPAEMTAQGRVYDLSATSWGAVTIAPAPLGTNARTQALTYRFDYEIEEPLIRTGGALISRIKVLIRPPENERFEVPIPEEETP